MKALKLIPAATFFHSSRFVFALGLTAIGVGLGVASSAQGATIVVTSMADSGAGCLRDAISSSAAGDTIVFTNTLAGQTIHLTNGELLISNSVTIDASGLAEGLLIDAGAQSRVMEIGTNATVTLDSLTLTNGSAMGDGSGIYVNNGATLVASNCTLVGNSTVRSGGWGGGIENYGIVMFNTCMLSNNSTGEGGGSIFNAGTFTLSHCILTGNSASFEGGGIDNFGGTLIASNCTFSSNSADSYGGGVVNEGTTALDRCNFSDNSAGGGGGIYNDGMASINNCTFSRNSAGYGGGVSNGGGPLVLNNCTLSSNSVNSVGGGFEDDGTATLNGSTLSSNSAGYAGGGIGNGYGSVLTLNNCTLSGNSAGSGAGIDDYENYPGALTLNNCTISGNSTSGLGGGINSYFTVVAMTNSIVAGNTESNGPDIYGGFDSGINNFTNGDPQLASLGNYGGPTQTMPPLSGSPAIDAGTDSVTNFLAADQRNYPRFSGAHVDIGAVEAQFVATPTNNPPVLKDVFWFSEGGSNAFQFAFTNVTEADFTALASTNLALPLAEWTVLGNIPEVSSGKYQFTDSSTTNSVQRFYRVVSP